MHVRMEQKEAGHPEELSFHMLGKEPVNPGSADRGP